MKEISITEKTSPPPPEFKWNRFKNGWARDKATANWKGKERNPENYDRKEQSHDDNDDGRGSRRSYGWTANNRFVPFPFAHTKAYPGLPARSLIRI